MQNSIVLFLAWGRRYDLVDKIIEMVEEKDQQNYAMYSSLSYWFEEKEKNFSESIKNLKKAYHDKNDIEYGYRYAHLLMLNGDFSSASEVIEDLLLNHQDFKGAELMLES